MEIVETFSQARAHHHGAVGLVPTMGYLHEGHLSLIERARRECDTVLVSLFVNPLQFGPGEDFESYPRHLERDSQLVAHAGADVLFAPPSTEMYPEPPFTRVAVPSLSAAMEGRDRPDHFEGVATVVTKLLAALQPGWAYFGRKDAQQLAIITRLAFDLSFPVTIVGCSTVREFDGLALSSRNSYVSEEERPEALALSRGLMAAANAIESGERSGPILEAIVRTTAPNTEFSYVQLMSRRAVQRLETLTEDAFLAAAASVGRARLIDNIHIDVTPAGCEVDRGKRLTGPSILYGE